MPLITREEKGSKLTIQEMDGNLIYLDDKVPYKVYTALLTQTGGSNSLQINSGELIVGVTYNINQSDIGTDFRNVGGPLITYADEFLDTYFVATGTTPNSWLPTTFLSYNTGAPVVTVLENTIGNIWFTYNVEGNYNINSNDLFTAAKTVSPNSQTACFNSGTDSFYNLIIQYQTGDYMELITINDGFATLDNQLTNKMIEIRVYN